MNMFAEDNLFIVEIKLIPDTQDELSGNKEWY